MINLLESIKVLNGSVYNLNYHQQRCDNSLKALHVKKRYNLKNLIHPPKNGLFRCRIVYNDKNIHVSYHAYQFQAINCLKLVYSDIRYPLKYQNRDELDKLFNQKHNCNDIVIVKNNLITDTTKANLAFFDIDTWYTPKTPLLHGTTRQYLLDKKWIHSLDITVNEINKFQKIAIMNAMIGFYIIKNGIIS